MKPFIIMVERACIIGRMDCHMFAIYSSKAVRKLALSLETLSNLEPFIFGLGKLKKKRTVTLVNAVPETKSKFTRKIREKREGSKLKFWLQAHM